MVNPAPLFTPQQLAAAAATLYTSQSAVVTLLKKFTVSNPDAANGYFVTLYIVPLGSVAGASNILVNARSVGPGQSIDIPEIVNQILNPGDFISAFADTAAKLTVHGAGVKFA